MRHLGTLGIALLVGCAGIGGTSTSTKDGERWSTRAAERGAVRVERSAPSEVPIGQAFQYELRVENVTRDPVEDVVLVERACDGLALEGAEPKPDSMEGGVAKWAIGGLKPGEAKTILVRGTPSKTGDLDCNCEVTCRTPVYGTVLVVEPKLALAAETPAAALAGETITLSYTVSNPGTGRAKTVAVTATLPEGVERIEGGRDVKLELAELAAGASKTFKVPAWATKTGSFALRANATAEGGLAAETPETPLVVTQPVLAVSVAAPEKWILERPLLCSVTVKNGGDGDAREARLEVALPKPHELVAEAGKEAPRSAGANRFAWALGTLKPGEERTVEFHVKVKAAGDLTLDASASAFCAASATASKATAVAGVAALLLDVADAIDPVVVGGDAVYRIAVTNQGTAAATNIAIACEIEDGMEAGATVGATEGKAEGRTIAFAPLPSLAPGETATWKVVVRATKEGDARFKVSLRSDQLERPVEETESTRLFK